MRRPSPSNKGSQMMNHPSTVICSNCEWDTHKGIPVFQYQIKVAQYCNNKSTDNICKAKQNTYKTRHKSVNHTTGTRQYFMSHKGFAAVATNDWSDSSCQSYPESINYKGSLSSLNKLISHYNLWDWSQYS